MTLELWNTFATFGTFAVIAATAIAALVQLRHARGSNQIAALKELNDEAATPRLAEAEHLVRTELSSKLEDPEFRYQAANPASTTPENLRIRLAARDFGNYYENMGLLLRAGLVDTDVALNLFSGTASLAWEWLAPFTAIMRQSRGDSVWENFEYFVVLSQDWIEAHPHGVYPPGVRRILLKSEWLQADAKYAASRAPA